MNIFDEYINYHNDSIKKYGEKTVVFMEVGSFFEIYAIMNDDENEGPNIYEICNLFNIQVTKKNKSIEKISRSNFLMAGFPNHSAQKFIDIMMNNNYTVVIVEQVTTPPKSKRGITKVISPSTYVDNIKQYESNIMMCFYIEKVKSFKNSNEYNVMGWSSFDASTGNSICNEETSYTDDKLLVDEIYRIILSCNPREVVFISLEDDSKKSFDSEKLISRLDLNNCCIHNKFFKLSKQYTELNYQKEILKKVFNNTGLLSVIEFIDLEFRPYALISFVYMIQFIFEHGENILCKLKKPIITKQEDDKMILAHNALNQLNVIGKQYNLLECLNKCRTSVGKRFFKKVLLNPITNVTELNHRYDTIESFIVKFDDLKKTDMKLNNVIDLERMFRKIACNHIQPCELYFLVNSITKLNDIIHDVYKHTNIKEKIEQLSEYMNDDKYSSFMNYINSNLNLRILSQYNLDNLEENIFQTGVYCDLDKVIEKRDKLKEELNNIVNIVNENDEMKNWLKLDKNDRDGFHFIVTKKRWGIILNELKERKDCEEKKHITEMTQFSQSGSNIRLNSSYIKSINQNLQKIDDEVIKLSVKYFKSFINDIYHCYGTTWFGLVVSLLEKIDFYIACAKNAVCYCLSKPTILPNDEGQSSFVELKDVRHILIENIQKDIEYTPNSIMIGERSATNNKGIILFGVNASGKSSFMKSVGLAIIQAQAGMYVPCKSMCYTPYDHVFTRIQSSDDILKGLSTFSNEISELRNIFKRITCNSLVIGDELCAGTESISALSIVTAGIETLVKTNTSFIFATHLHELNEMSRIEKLITSSDIAIKHLSVEYDEKKGCLIYDRVIKDGPGTSLYGLEVCKAMDMNPHFIHLANTIRQEILSEDSSHEMIKHKRSRYNKDLMLNKCSVCANSGNLETHHIKFQKDATKNGFIDDRFHKNSKFNLVALCQGCHDKVHNNSLLIEGWKQTTNGTHLQFKYL